MRKYLLLFLLLPLCTLCSTNKSGEQSSAAGEGTEEYFHTRGEIFRTQSNFKYKYHRALDDEIFARLDSFDRSLNPFNKQSIIYKVNNNLPAALDDWFIQVFETARQISEQSEGIYDITAAPLINLWGFGYDEAKEPSRQTIDSIKEFVGYQKARLVDRAIVKDDPRVQINASSIAKGFAVDVVSELLESYGIGDYMVEIGGEVRARGLNPQGGAWKIGISKPIDDNTGKPVDNFAVIQLEDKSLATSGNSRNYYIKDGKKYAHTIDPLSGYPFQSDLLSATVIHSECIFADALATTFMAMGMEKALRFAESYPGIQYIFIYSDENGEFQSITSGENDIDIKQ